MKKIPALVFLALLLAWPASSSGQTALTADRIYLGAAGCALMAKAGAPTGGLACDFQIDSSSGDLWVKVGATWINVSKIVDVSRGGTGLASIPAGAVLYGNGTAPLGVTGAPAANSVLGVAGGVPIFTTGPSVVSLTASSTIRTPEVSSSSGPLALRPAGDLILDPGSRAVLPGANFGVSFGSPTNRFLALHLGELWAETLVSQDVLATIGGRVMVAPTTLLVTDLAPGSSSIATKGNNLQNGDVVYLQAAPGGIPQIEFMRVTSASSGAGPYTYTVTRNLDGSGANAWTAGDAVVNTGTTGNGFIDLYALAGIRTGYGPAIVGNVRTGTAYNAISPRWAIGNLNGAGFGHTSDTYGAAFGNPAGAYVYTDDTNGLVMGGPAGDRVRITPAGAATFTGDGGGVTNINGGNIQTDTIGANQIAANAITASELAAGAVTAGKIAAGAVTADTVAAGAITVAQINATGYGDNLIKNGAFEPNVGENIGAAWTASSTAFAGWVKAADFSSAGNAINACCGLLGPGTMQIDPGAGNGYFGMQYLAVPIEGTSGPSAGVQYRISARVYSSVASQAFYIVVSEYGGGQGGVRRVRRQGPVTLPDVVQDSETIVVACGVLPAGWNTVEYSYTPPASIRMASIAIYNASAVCGGAYAGLFIDDVEMQKQIGAGHISANSITANHIQAGAITTGKIAAGAVTATQIAAGTITGDRIAASTIAGGNIAGGTITGGNIAGGTITAGNLAAGSITADKLNVTALSAISANLGNVTAGSITGGSISGGTINGTTITGGSITSNTSISGVNISGSSLSAGGGAVTVDGSGITIAAGDSNGSARLKLGSVQLWGSGGCCVMVTSGDFEANALRAHAGVTFETTLHVQGATTVDTTLNVGGVLTGSSHIYTGGNLYIPNGSSAWWTSGGPPISSGGTLGFDNGCGCLVRLSSSSRYKENIKTWAPLDALALLKLPLVRFDIKNDPGVSIGSRDHVGFLAEDLARFLPDAVVRDNQGRPDSFNSQAIDAYEIAALRAVNDRVSALEAKIRALELELAKLKGGKE